MERLKRIWSAIKGEPTRAPINIGRIEINIPKESRDDMAATGLRLADAFVELRRSGKAAS